MMGNNVVHPEHYNQGKIECVDAIKESMSHEAYLGFLKGNAMKYLWRYEGKNKPIEDLEKAQYYISLLIGALGEKPVIDQFGKSVSEIYREVDDGRFTE